MVCEELGLEIATERVVMKRVDRPSQRETRQRGLSPEMNQRRHALGIIGIVLILVGLALSGFGGTSGGGQFAVGACIRVGSLAVLLWLALPSVMGLYRYFPKWIWAISGLALLVAALNGRLIVLVGVLFAVLVFFQLAGWFLSGLRGETDRS